MRRLRSAMIVAVALLICHGTADAPAAEPAAAPSGAPRTDEEGVGGKMFRKAVRGGQNLAFYEPVVLPAYPFAPGPTEVFPDAP